MTSEKGELARRHYRKGRRSIERRRNRRIKMVRLDSGGDGNGVGMVSALMAGGCERMALIEGCLCITPIRTYGTVSLVRRLEMVTLRRSTE